jgi:hypothetical protein
MKFKKIMTYLLIVTLVLVMSGCGNDNTKNSYENDNNSNKQENNSTSNDYENNYEEPVVEYSESDQMIMKIMTLIDEGLAFDTGSYVKGDIPKGEYAFIKFEGSGSYYSEEDAAGNIIDNENFDSFGYVKVHGVGDIETRGVLIKVSAFEKLEVSSAKEIYEILNEQEDYNQSGYYKVGVDIKPGTYTVESFGNGYYAILDGPIGDYDIIDNDFFKGKATIRLKKGQYLNLSSAQILEK